MLVRVVRSSSVLLYLLAAPLAATSVYVPFGGQDVAHNLGLQARVAVTNRGSAPATIETVFLATDTDGTQRTGEPQSREVAAGQTVILTHSATQIGLLEIAGPDELLYQAHLALVGDAADILPLPVIDAERAYGPGEPLYLQGLPRDPARPTALTLVNLGQFAATCTASILGPNGGTIAAPTSLSLQPLSHRQFPDVLAGLAGATDVRLDVACDQSFFAFALVGRGESEGLAAVLPSQRANLGIATDDGGPAACPPGGYCFEQLGVVHVPSQGHPVERFVIPVPAGTYQRIHLRLDVKHAGWDAKHPNGRHHLFWLVNSRNLNMYGNGDLYGPKANYLDVQHGIGLVHEDKVHLIESFAAQPGATYHLDYVYDTGERFIELVVTQGGNQVARVRGVPNVGQIAVAASDEILLDIGFDGSNPLEPITKGWTYSNLKVEFEP